MRGDVEVGSSKIFPEDERCAYCESKGCLPRTCAWWKELVDSEDERRNRKGPSRVTFKPKKTKRETLRPKSKGPASSERAEHAATGSPDVSRRPPLPKKAKDDESSSRQSSTSGKSRSSGGARTDRHSKSPRRELDDAFATEAKTFQCSTMGCGKETVNSNRDFVQCIRIRRECPIQIKTKSCS